MPPMKRCPICGNICVFKEIVPYLVFGFECDKCGHVFDTHILYIGNREVELWKSLNRVRFAEKKQFFINV